MRLGSGLTVLIGGARSGKSDLAVKLGSSRADPVAFVATGEAIDEDMAARIARHKLDRPDHWQTFEEPRFGADDVAQISDDALLILDCLTLLVSNLLLADRTIADHVSRLAVALDRRSGPTIVVTNEVGMGVHPETSLGRRYRDELGSANRIMADSAQAALLVVAGRALRLEDVSW